MANYLNDDVNFLADELADRGNYLRQAKINLNNFMQYRPVGAPANVGDMAKFGLNIFPGIGDAIALEDAKREYEAGNTGMAAFNALTALPGIGDAATLAKVSLPAVAGAGGLLSMMVRRTGKAPATPFSKQTGVIGADDSIKGEFMDMPLYHGMAGDIEGAGFSLGRGGDVSRSRVGTLGVSVGLDPETAAEFARLAARGAKGKEGEAIVPLLHRAKNPTSLRLVGNEKNLEIAATIEDAWDTGYDAIMIKNYTTPGGKKGVDFIIVKDPAQLRSPYAKFKKENKYLNNLLGGMGAISVFGATQAKEKPVIK